MVATRIPATVITGFLGAGKTTLIRNLLEKADGQRFALIVNEFGDVGVDGDVLSSCNVPGCSEDDIIELANGCICCTVADDFLPSMQKLLQAEPKPITSLLKHLVLLCLNRLFRHLAGLTLNPKSCWMEWSLLLMGGVAAGMLDHDALDAHVRLTPSLIMTHRSKSCFMIRWRPQICWSSQKVISWIQISKLMFRQIINLLPMAARRS